MSYEALFFFHIWSLETGTLISSNIDFSLSKKREDRHIHIKIIYFENITTSDKALSYIVASQTKSPNTNSIKATYYIYTYKFMKH